MTHECVPKCTEKSIGGMWHTNGMSYNKLWTFERTGTIHETTIYIYIYANCESGKDKLRNTALAWSPVLSKHAKPRWLQGNLPHYPSNLDSGFIKPAM